MLEEKLIEAGLPDDGYRQPLEEWLDAHPLVNPDMFLQAQIDYGVTSYYGMTRKSSMSRYLTFMRKLRSSDYDDPGQIKWAVESLKFAVGNCLDLGITLRDYPNHKPVGQLVPTSVVHMKRSRVSIGFLLMLGAFGQLTRVFQEEEYGDFYFHGLDPYKETGRLKKAQKYPNLVKKLIKRACISMRNV